VPHSKEWYRGIARAGRGYQYTWDSILGAGHPDEEYTRRVLQLVSRSIDVVDCGCGHGEDVLAFAPLVRTIVGYDQIDEFIQLAESARIARGIENATFVAADSASSANGGVARMPLASSAIDLFLSRRGPTHWVEDVPRVARAGAILVQLNPMPVLAPRWMSCVPSILLSRELTEPVLERRLSPRLLSRIEQAGIEITSQRLVEALEWFPSPRDLYHFLTWGKDERVVPAYNEIATSLELVFRNHASSEGLEFRRAGLIWEGTVGGLMNRRTSTGSAPL